MHAGSDFSDAPMETLFIPSWARVKSAIPNIEYQLRRAVEEDNRELDNYLHVVPKMSVV